MRSNRLPCPEQEQRPSGNGDREAIVVGDSGRFGKRRIGKNIAAYVSAKKYAETSQVKNICRNVSYDMWGISGGCTLALTVTKTSSHYDRFAISVPARSLLLFDLA